MVMEGRREGGEVMEGRREGGRRGEVYTMLQDWFGWKYMYMYVWYGTGWSLLNNSYMSSRIYKPEGPELLRARGFINIVYPIGRDV